MPEVRKLIAAATLSGKMVIWDRTSPNARCHDSCNTIDGQVVDQIASGTRRNG
jgi:hypothetical protein